MKMENESSSLERASMSTMTTILNQESYLRKCKRKLRILGRSRFSTFLIL